MVKSIVQFIQTNGIFYAKLSDDQRSSEVARILSSIVNIQDLLNSQITNLLYFITDLITSVDLIKDDLEFLETALSHFQ